MNQNYNKIRDGIIRQGIEIDKKMAEEKLDQHQKNFLIKQVKTLGQQLAFGYYMKESKQMFDDFMTKKEKLIAAKVAALKKTPGEVPEAGEGLAKVPSSYKELFPGTFGEPAEGFELEEYLTPGEQGSFERSMEDRPVEPTRLNDPIKDKIVTDPMERKLMESQETGAFLDTPWNELFSHTKRPDKGYYEFEDVTDVRGQTYRDFLSRPEEGRTGLDSRELGG